MVAADEARPGPETAIGDVRMPVESSDSGNGPVILGSKVDRPRGCASSFSLHWWQSNGGADPRRLEAAEDVEVDYPREKLEQYQKVRSPFCGRSRADEGQGQGVTGEGVRRK
ncbi:MAG: hypothetical protein M1825_005752 [Sarcosagium campestre]|nr:MAG: hypothetical protein M1825_005752 [Sarcosagium campestre]